MAYYGMFQTEFPYYMEGMKNEVTGEDVDVKFMRDTISNLVNHIPVNKLRSIFDMINIERYIEPIFNIILRDLETKKPYLFTLMTNGVFTYRELNQNN